MSWSHRAALMALLALATVAPASAQEEDGGDIPVAARRRMSPISATPDVLKVGAALWRQHCFTCHGATGHGDGPNARLHAARKAAPRNLSDPLVQDNLTDGEIFWRIGNGIIEDDDVIMPAFGEQIPGELERWELVQFVRTLRAKPGEESAASAR